MNAPDRLPPQARDSERSLLACLLAHPDKLDEVRDLVAVEDFYLDAHQRVFGAMLRLHDRRHPFDVVGLRDELKARGDLADVGDDMLGELAGDGGFAHEWHVQRVQDKALKRAMIHAAVDLVNDSYADAGPADEILDRAQSRLDRLAARGAGPDAPTVAACVNEAIDGIDARGRGERPAGVPTGFPSLDDVLCGGFRIGGLTVLAARPSVGKTSFSVQAVRNVCEQGRAVFFASLEQPRVELTERLLANVAEVDGKRIQIGKLTAEESTRLSSAADVVRGWRSRIDDTPTRTAGQIAAAARRARRALKGLDLVVIDYLGLVAPDNAKANRNEQTGTSCRRLRGLARELGVPVLLLCQLNRAAADDEIPRLHHLRDSGEIEQHADVVAFLHRAGQRAFGKPDRIELHVAKQRNGPTDVIAFEHRTAVFTFSEADVID